MNKLFEKMEGSKISEDLKSQTLGGANNRASQHHIRTTYVFKGGDEAVYFDTPNGSEGFEKIVSHL